MAQKNTPRKVLFILWKWKLREEWVHINANTFLPKYLENLDAGKGIFYQEFKVKPSDYCPHAITVAASIYNDGDNTRQLLYKLLDQYAVNGNQLILLIHRADGYKEQDLQEILQTYGVKIDKCILFEGGRDYIYHNTQKSGLLNDVGGFFRGRNRDGKPVEVINKQQEIQQPYFDRVWRYYEGEFEHKVFALKEDLFDELFSFLLPQKPENIDYPQLKKALQSDKNKLLWLRLLSFMGEYTQISSKELSYEQERKLLKQQKELADLEKESYNSYVFDACIVNLESPNKKQNELEASAYREARDCCKNLLIYNDTGTVSKTDLRVLAERLDYLVKVIPGVID